MTKLRLAIAAVLVLPSLALADDGWKPVSSQGGISVKSRPRAGTAVKEFWVETDFDAAARALQDVLVDTEHFRDFMPYVKESRFVGKPEADGSVYAYIRLDPPGGQRDYIVKSTVTQKVGDDGKGAFAQSWKAEPDKFPARHHIIRVRVNEGSWLITPVGPKKSHAVYKFAVDPGGNIPAFAADMANQSGIAGSLKAIEKEAQKRAAKR